MQKKEIITYFFITAILIGTIFVFYFSNLSLVGYSIFEQNTLTAFNEGVYQNNTEYDVNLSAVILSVNQTSGTYMSKVFDGGDNAVWNNLTYNGQGSLAFEVRGCSSADCSNNSFVTADLNNLNLSGRYFQYKVLFNMDPNITTSLSSVSINSGTTQVVIPSYLTILISQPVGEKASISGVPVQYIISSNANYSNPSCVYNVKYLNGTTVINNTAISGCGNISFNLADTEDRNYVFTLNVNSSLGFFSNTSSFYTNIPADTEEEEEEIPVVIPQNKTVDLSVSSIEKKTLSPLSSENYNVLVKNIGNVAVSGCKASGLGDYSSWISTTQTNQSLNVGEEKTFNFVLKAPETPGSYEVSLSLKCSGFSKTSKFVVDVVKKTVAFNLTDVRRVRADKVRVIYSLGELSGEDQTVGMTFFLYDSQNSKVANMSVSNNLSANEVEDFRNDIPVNKSLEGNITLLVDYKSGQYSSYVNKKISLGAYTGFSVFGGGTGSVIVVVVMVLVLALIVVILFVLKGPRKFLKGFINKTGN